MSRPLLHVVSLAAAVLIAGCDGGYTPPLPAAPRLPAVTELPYGIDQGCDCVERRMCPNIEMVMGNRGIRKLSCRWIEPGSVAECRFESNFDPIPSFDGEPDLPPGAWEPQRLVARRLPGGRWCALDPQLPR